MPLVDIHPFRQHLQRAYDDAPNGEGFLPAYHGAFDHDVFADHLEDHGDPRADLVRERWRGPGQGVHPFLGASKAAGGGTPGHSTHAGSHTLPDGSQLTVARYEGPGGAHWGASWDVGDGKGTADSVPTYQRAFTEDEFRGWVGRFGKEHATNIIKAVKPQSKGVKKVRWKFAADRRPGRAAAVREVGSANHEARTRIAREILREAGLSPAVVRAALAHEGDRSVPGVVQVLIKRVDPARIRYAAAWYGLLSNSPAVTVFHPTDGGEDTLHVISSPHPAEHIAGYLRRLGVPKFATESHGAGTRAYVYDPGSKMNLTNAIGGLDASHSAVRGTGFRLGGGPGAGSTAGSAAARATYRDTISDYERA